MPARKKAVTKKKATGTAMVDVQAQLQKELENVADATSSSGGNKIRVTQGKMFVAPDGEETRGPIEVVIVDYTTHNLFYDEPFDRDNPQPPSCFAIAEPASLGGKIKNMKPSPNASDPQADSCETCPMNEWNTGASGRGKACKNTRVLAIATTDADAETPLSSLSVSPTGLKSFDGMVKTLKSKQTTPIQVVTEVSLSEEVDFPRLVFRPIEPNPHFEAHFARRAEAQALLQEEPDLTVTERPKRGRRVTKKKTSRRSRAA